MRLVITQKPFFDEELDRVTESSDLSFETQMEYIYRVFGAIVKLDIDNIPQEINQVFCRFSHYHFKEVVVEITYSNNPSVTLHGDFNALKNLIVVFLSQETFMMEDVTAKTISQDMSLDQLLFLWNYAFPSNPIVVEKETPVLKFPIVIKSPSGFIGNPLVIQQGELEESMKKMEAALSLYYGSKKTNTHWKIVEGDMVFTPSITLNGGVLTLNLSNE